ncbi:MAG: right-handed parallel beta-helix repeat-containing protein, partial [Pseudomonadota bacterium]
MSSVEFTTVAAATSAPVAPTILPAGASPLEVMTGRVETLSVENAASVRLLSQPEHGHVSVNPDGTIALVLTLTDYVGALSFDYEVELPGGGTEVRTAQVEAIPGLQEAGWGTGANHYMLAVDENDRVIVEHGDNHRKVYVTGSEDGLTAEDIAAREGVAAGAITRWWLRDNPEYGGSEELALSAELGAMLWETINPRGSQASNWLLLERGYAYEGIPLVPREAAGASPLAPMYIADYGEGLRPFISEQQNISGNNSDNIIISNVEIQGSIRLVGGANNILVENARLSQKETIFQGADGNILQGITIRNTAILDAYDEAPTFFEENGTWSPLDSRESGLYVSNTHGLLLEGIVLDHNGWSPGFDPNGLAAGPQPPSMFSHNAYIQFNTSDVTFRDSSVSRGASHGVQFRGGAFVEDSIFFDNNIAFNALGGASGEHGHTQNYSLIHGASVFSAAARGANAPMIGALDWGIIDGGRSTSLIDTIVAHANDPDNSLDTTLGSNALTHKEGKAGVAYDDTIMWRWGVENANVDGLDPEVLNQTTIQHYTAQLLGQETATVDDFAEYMRSLDGAQYAAAVEDVLTYFRDGFGIDTSVRTDPTTLRFIPDARGDGVRWDNRLNWSSGDLPGTRDGDSVDLGGNTVVFGGTVALTDLHFGNNGELLVPHGRLTVEGELTVGVEGGALMIERAGQFWTNGFDGGGHLDIDVTGGRFANTRDFLGQATLTATDGQVVLGVDDALYAVTDGAQLEIFGAEARVGFDGAENGIALLGLNPGGTLAFTAADGAIGTIAEFRTGALGDAPQVGSGVDLGDGVLFLNLADLDFATTEAVLIQADELIGMFSRVDVAGLGDRALDVIVDYEADQVRLRLGEAAGAVGTVELFGLGDETSVDAGDEAVMQALIDAQGSYEEAGLLPWNAGDDVFEPSPGDDVLDGGAGFDTARFSGDGEDYAIAFAEDGLRVSGPDGDDLLIDVERLEFADGAWIEVAVEPAPETDAGAPEIDAPVAFSAAEDAPAQGLVAEAASIEISFGGWASTPVFTAGDGNSLLSVSSEQSATLVGGDAENTLSGGDGDDSLDGGGGDDALYGGEGRDLFVFEGRGGQGFGADRIGDFAPGEDLIEADWAGSAILDEDGGDLTLDLGAG